MSKDHHNEQLLPLCMIGKIYFTIFTFWTINRYVGIRSQIAPTEIKHIESIFDDNESFAGEDWNIRTSCKSGGLDRLIFPPS
jgi:hypothetical protein